MTSTRWRRVPVAAVMAAFSVLGVLARQPLTFEERVKAQEAVERVYYNHRIWPKENPGPKPPFEQMVTKAQIEAKVTDYLKKSAALDSFWQRPITGDQLQAEMDRMARGTKDPATLLELFAALDHDPDLIAECLARPILADRLIRNWYAYDTRFHERAKLESEQAYEGLTAENLASNATGVCSRVTYVLADPSTRRGKWTNRSDRAAGEVEIPLGGQEYERILRESPAPGRVTRSETEGAFILTLCTLKSADRIQLATLSFPKQDLDAWWGKVRGGLVGESLPSPPPALGYRIIPAPVPSADCTDDWSAGGLALSASSTARSYHTAVWTGTEMIVWGGRNLEYLNTGGRYSPATDTWSATSTGANVPTARLLHSAVWTGTEMIVWGGGALGGDVNTGGRYNPVSDSWTSTSTGVNCPPAIEGHTAVWTGSEMIVWGGYAYPSRSNLGGRYNPGTDSWVATSTGTNCPSPRSRHTAVWTGEVMIVWGGENGSWGLATGGRYSPATDTWLPTSTSASPLGRADHCAVWTGSEMIAWGGGGGLNSGGRYNPAADAWVPTSVAAGCPSGRKNFTAVWTGSRMIVWGGASELIGPGSGGVYDPVADAWTPTSTGPGCPSIRRLSSAIWTGTEMIVWGGEVGEYASLRHLNTGGRYDANSDTWVSTAVSPTSRYLHTAVWTGAEMVVWGGYDGADTNTGGRYSLATDAWQPTSTGPWCPLPQWGHAAVWTGTEMIVWGGDYTRYQGDPLYFMGGRYNPTSDSWSPMSEWGAPPNRTYAFVDSSFSAVWTGSRMIVWGGMDAETFGYLATGGQYDPAANAWTPVSTGPNCPSARADHSGIWTGDEMVIWGGWNGNSDFADGARYSPVTDQWAPLNAGVNCPVGRDQHTAIWTGTDMVVWGGWDVAGNRLDSGAHWNPSSDSWTPTADGPARPSARMLHSALYTGEEMVLWGGWEDWGILLNTGGRYNPKTRTWLPMATSVNCPSARALFTSLWTGSGVIVWGGEDIQSAPLGDGALYRPSPTIQSLSNCAPALLFAGSGSSYQWLESGTALPGATSSSYLASTAGTYTVEVSFGTACTRSSGPYVVSALPPPTVSGATAGCAGSTVALSCDAFSAYQWIKDGVDIPGATSQGYAASVSGTYTVRVTDASGCVGTSPGHSVTIWPNPAPTVSGPATACSTASLSTGSFTSYQWHRNGSIIAGATGQSYWAPAPGSYTVSVTDGNGCAGTSAAFVVHAPPVPAVSGPSSGCGSVPLSTGTFSSYQWNQDGTPVAGATAQIFSATTSGRYSVTVTDANGCEGTSTAQTVTVHPLPVPAVTGAFFNTCPATSVSLSASAGYVSYQWALNGAPIAGATGSSLAAGVTGYYSVTVEDSWRCAGTSEGHPVFVDFCAGSEVSPAQALFPAHLRRDSASPTGYYLYFQRLDTLDGYNVYEGTLGIWYSHAGAAGNACAAFVEDLGTGEMRAAIAPSEGDHYYLVTAFGGGVEGPSGFRSDALEIDPTQSTCAP